MSDDDRLGYEPRVHWMPPGMMRRGHCPPELLDDLADVFAEVRTWPGVVEKSRGVFSLNRGPFLHFHRTAEGGRRADVKSPAGWISLDLPRPLSAVHRRRFLRVLRAVHRRPRPGRVSTRAARTR